MNWLRRVPKAPRWRSYSTKTPQSAGSIHRDASAGNVAPGAPGTPGASRPAGSAAVKKSYTEIALDQRLYMIDKTTPGSIFFLPHGTRLFDTLVSYMRRLQRQYGFEHVITPLLYKNDLWETSGHWDHYRDDMFHLDHEDGFSLKPMNCPGHCIMFGRFDRSFRELPIRYADFSPLHRNEASGALTGLTRVRKFHQDDGHIFCQHDQIEQEIDNCLKIIHSVYSTFDLGTYSLSLSTRPDEYAGEIEVWDQAERDLTKVLDSTGKPWKLNPGDGAFYGPKIDIHITDKTGKEHQTATIQLDFQLPQRFELSYDAPGGGQATPVLIHRAVYGSIERFMALLIDHYQGKWPFWLNPRQAVIIPVADRHQDYAQSVYNKLSGTDITAEPSDAVRPTFHVELAAVGETVPARIRTAIADGASYILVVGDKEIETQSVAIRSRESRATEVLKVDRVIEKFTKLTANHE